MRTSERKKTVISWILGVVWFLAAIQIAAGPLGITPDRSNLWIVLLIFLGPIAAWAVALGLINWVRKR